MLNLGTATNPTNLSEKQLLELQPNEQILTLQAEIKTLEQQLKDNQYSINSLENTLESITNENEQLQQQYEEARFAMSNCVH